MRTFFRRFLFFFLLIAIPIGTAVAQEGEWYLGKPIVDIEFTGLENIDSSELEPIVEPYIGQDFTDDLFLELQSKLYALDYFETFIPNALPGDENFESIIINFEVEERAIIDEINLQGNRNIRRNDILDVVLLKEGDMVNRTKVRLDSDAVRELYLERGYPNVTVEGEIEELADRNAAVVTFTIDEGNQTRIRDIRFSGNSFASEGTLRRVMETKEQSLFSKGVFQESEFEEDLSRIENYYWEKGYINAAVVDVVREIEVDEEDERNYMIITIYIDEGEQYTYGGMEFEGNVLFSDEELRKDLRLKEGNVLDKTKLEADFLRVTDLYYNDGYIYNVITKEEIVDEVNNVVSYEVSIVERDRAHIENILFQGNEKTKDFVIRRELPFQVGDVFSKQLIMEGLQNLYNTGLFSVVTPTTPMGSTEGLMDLVINIEEAKTIDLEFGVTFSGAAGTFPIMGFLKWTDRNFLGRGTSISAGTELSNTTQRLNFSYTENWLFNRRWSWGVDFSIQHALTQNVKQDILAPVFSPDDVNAVPDPYEGYYVFSEDTNYSGSDYEAGTPFPGIPSDTDIEDYELVTDYQYDLSEGKTISGDYLMQYDSFDFSLGLNTGYTWHLGGGRLGLSTGLRTSLEYLTYDNSLYRPYNPTTRDNLNAWQFTNKLWLNLSWDTRDYILNPSTGYHLNQNFQYVGGFLFGVSNFMRSSTKAEVFFTLFDIPVATNWNWKMVLALHSDFALILPQFRHDPGTGAWGWGTELKDIDYLYTDSMQIARGWGWRTGGKARWNNWIELRMPIIEQYLWWDFFFSGTAMYEELAHMTDMSMDDFLFTFGGGIRLTIPGFPIGFFLAKRFRTNDGAVDWQTGNIGGVSEGAGIDFVISFTYEIF